MKILTVFQLISKMVDKNLLYRNNYQNTKHYKLQDGISNPFETFITKIVDCFSLCRQ
jgi:hypothetical protein